MGVRHGLRETTITGRGQVTLPASEMRELGWQRGDRLIVERRDDDTILLRRRPRSWTKRLAGMFTDVFGTTEENVALIRADRDESARP